MPSLDSGRPRSELSQAGFKVAFATPPRSQRQLWKQIVDGPGYRNVEDWASSAMFFKGPSMFQFRTGHETFFNIVNLNIQA